MTRSEYKSHGLSEIRGLFVHDDDQDLVRGFVKMLAKKRLPVKPEARIINNLGTTIFTGYSMTTIDDGCHTALAVGKYVQPGKAIVLR